MRYTEKKRAGLVPLQSYNPAISKGVWPPMFTRDPYTGKFHPRDGEAVRHQAKSYAKFMQRQAWRTNLITVNGAQPYTQALPEVARD